MCYEGPHDPADLVEVGPVAVLSGGWFPTEVGEVEGGAVFPLGGELFGEEVLGFAAAARAPEEEPVKGKKKMVVSNWFGFMVALSLQGKDKGRGR